MTQIWKLTAAAVLFVGSAGLAMAEGQPSSAAETQQQQFKGPPNANGYGKDQDSGRSAAEPSGATTPSPNGMKGPPNANGYQK